MAYYTDKEIQDDYKFEKELGRGSFAIVKQAVHRQTGKVVAVKCIDRQSLDDDEENSL